MYVYICIHDVANLTIRTTIPPFPMRDLGMSICLAKTARGIRKRWICSLVDWVKEVGNSLTQWLSQVPLKSPKFHMILQDAQKNWGTWSGDLDIFQRPISFLSVLNRSISHHEIIINPCKSIAGLLVMVRSWFCCIEWYRFATPAITTRKRRTLRDFGSLVTWETELGEPWRATLKSQFPKMVYVYRWGYPKMDGL